MPDADPAALCDLAADLAREAGALLLAGHRQVRTDITTKSSATDMVSEMDHASERLIVERLLVARPDDGVLGEEGAERAGRTGVRWIIDPLDGTTNYLYGFGAFAVSIGVEIDGRAVAGVVHDPLHHETYRAVAGAGAWCGDRRLEVAGPPSLATALVGTGFSYDAGVRGEQALVLARVLPAVRDLRRAGAAALDLCWVAAGRLDAYFERGLAPWDWAAGSLVAAEAGARTAILANGTYLVAPPALFDPLVALVG